MRKLLLIGVFFSFGHVTTGQTIEKDSSENKFTQTKNASLWVPLSLISLGYISSKNKFIINKYKVAEERNEKYRTFHTRIDDYLQYAPVAALYGLNAAGLTGKNNIHFQSRVLLKAELLMSGIILSLKKLTRELRPDSSCYSSFPSGHTAQAFLGAEILRKEYGAEHPWLAIGGYISASAVGTLRILNNKHWLPDILAGAGVGILSVNIIYATQNRRVNRKTVVMPTFSANQPGIYFARSF